MQSDDPDIQEITQLWVRTKKKTVDKTHVCRKRHKSPHVNNKKIRLCENCDDYVEVLDDNYLSKKQHKCACCGMHIRLTKKNKHKITLMEHGLIFNAKEIKNWMMFPTREPRHVRIKHKTNVYTIQIKHLVQYREFRYNRDYVNLLVNHLHAWGWNLKYHDPDEVSSIPCALCKNTVKVTDEGYVYCPQCNPRLEDA